MAVWQVRFVSFVDCTVRVIPVIYIYIRIYITVPVIYFIGIPDLLCKTQSKPYLTERFCIMSLISNERLLLQSKESKLQAPLWWERNDWSLMESWILRESWKSMEGEICGFSFHEKIRFCGEAISCYNACFPMYLLVHWKHRFDSLCGTLLRGPNFPVVQARLVLRELSAEFDFQGLVLRILPQRSFGKPNIWVDVSPYLKKNGSSFFPAIAMLVEPGNIYVNEQKLQHGPRFATMAIAAQAGFWRLRDLGLWGFNDGCWWKKSAY